MQIRKSMLMSSLTVVCATLCAAGAARAQVTVTPSVTFSNGLYHYDYSVTSTLANDIPLIDVDVAPQADAVQNLMAPSGFQATFDPGLGEVTFLEDTSTFGSTPVSGFTFDSPLPAIATQFHALTVDDNGGLSTLSGPTLGPQVPEPGQVALLAAFSLSGTLLLRRRNR
jgi:hypothetical protein